MSSLPYLRNYMVKKVLGTAAPIRYTANAGWSSLVARWAHNPKVAGSNPAPATMGTFRDDRKVPFLFLDTS